MGGAGILVSGHVFSARTVAALAGNAEHEIRGVVDIDFGIGNRGVEISGMTFQTTRNDRALEIGLAINIAGTDDPAMEDRGIADGKLKKLIITPIEIGLAFAAGADDEIKTLGARARRAAVGGSPNGGLEKLVARLIHTKSEIGIGSGHDVGAGSERAEDGVFVGELGSPIVCGLFVCVELLLVAFAAGLVADVFGAGNDFGFHGGGGFGGGTLRTGLGLRMAKQSCEAHERQYKNPGKVEA